MLKKPVQSLWRSVLALGVLATSLMPLQAQDVANGKSLFESNCTSCHAIQEKTIGPALKNVDQRHDEAWLIKWIRNSTAMIKSGDPAAVKLFNDNNKVAMSTFENFSDKDIKDILAYVKEESSKAPVVSAGPGEAPGTSGSPAPAPAAGSNMNTTVLAVLAVILILASILLIRINSFLKELILKKFPERREEEKETWYNSKFTPWVRGLNPTIAGLVITTVFMLMFGGWFFVYANTEIGVQQGYAPTQPINFSHKIHAGDHEIDCKYCHSSVEVSKQASVPAVSTCMNCHSYIDASKKYNGQVSPEIQKIRTAYETNTPVKWIRIHNLPDLAYFNHSQHVSVGKVECQTCHGPIETMDKVEQVASLQMGWCVNCHRESKVDVENNDYYEQLHADLEKRGKRSITVAHNGGLDCGKCHY
ncbi:MAG: c-type cytochrome [Bacteroidetes bacterium]|nr:c-type cytochrome [Bacteroidota bacterium]